MQINDEIIESKYIIQSCSKEGIVVDKKLYKSTLFITSDKIISPWIVPDIKSLKEKHLLDIIKMKPKVLIIGSGVKHFYLDNRLVFFLYSKKIGCEVMQTDAACRTYNLLSMDNREVCGLIFPI